MEKDAPRKQAVEDVQRQYESQLREAKRQRSVLEAELESSAERWRNERRRLNAEVDRLEAALAEARGGKQKPIGAKTDRGVDPLEIAKIHASADDKVRKAATEWESEREKLLMEISRLQRAVGDLIERSNNPIRSKVPMREELESKLSMAVRAKERIEAGYLREKAAWEEERLRITGELIRLRSATTQLKPLRGKQVVDERARELEARIGSMQKEMDRERNESRLQIQQMERRLADSRQSMNTDVVDQLRRQYDDRIQEMILQKTKLTDELRRASALLESERGRFMTSSAGTNNNSDIKAEVDRVQAMILEITKRIEDPLTDLSTVIRKNVERAELNAYLKGILYLTGTNKGI